MWSRGASFRLHANRSPVHSHGWWATVGVACARRHGAAPARAVRGRAPRGLVTNRSHKHVHAQFFQLKDRLFSTHNAEQRDWPARPYSYLRTRTHRLIGSLPASTASRKCPVSPYSDQNATNGERLRSTTLDSG